MKAVVFVIVALFVLLLSACGNNPAKQASSNPQTVAPISYGNGVYYFNCTGKQFAMSLSEFVSDGSRVMAMTGNGASPYGLDLGYFVVVDTTTTKGGKDANH